MSLFKNRFLVLVGGETTNEEATEGKSKKSSQRKRDSDSKINEDEDGNDDKE